MTWKDLLSLSTGAPVTLPLVLKGGIGAAMNSTDGELRTWVSSTRGLSTYALCSVLDDHRVEVPHALIEAVQRGESER